MTSLPRAKGARPAFLPSEPLDDLVAMVMALAQEVAVLRERCDTGERLLAEAGLLSLAAMEAYRAPPAVAEARETWRQDYLDRVLYALKARAEQQADGATPDAYAAVIAEVAA